VAWCRPARRARIARIALVTELVIELVIVDKSSTPTDPAVIVVVTRGGVIDHVHVEQRQVGGQRHVGQVQVQAVVGALDNFGDLTPLRSMPVLVQRRHRPQRREIAEVVRQEVQLVLQLRKLWISLCPCQ
jgi:hypothetical protein